MRIMNIQHKLHVSRMEIWRKALLDQLMTFEWVHAISNKQVVFTGGIDGHTRVELQRLAKGLGASSTPSDVSYSTKLLVRGTSSRWKYGDYGEKEKYAAKLQAQGHSIRIIDAAGFFGLLLGLPAPVIEPHVPEPSAVKLATEGGALGAPYRDGQYSTPVAGDGTAFRDPDNVGRGLQAHGHTQDILAAKLRSFGVEPLAPFSRDCNFDIAWISPSGKPWVAEVKSLTAENEAFQLRHALGQVLDYKHRLARRNFDATPCVALENRPERLEHWRSLYASIGVTLTFGPHFLAISAENTP